MAEVENVSINRPFYASNMYRQFIPAEPGHKKPKTSANNLIRLLTGNLTNHLRLQIIVALLGGKAHIASLMASCKAFESDKKLTLWTAPATWTEQDHVETLLKVMAESDTRWKQWINTSEVTALTLRDVDDMWMTSVFARVVTKGKFPKLTSLTLQSSSVTTLTVLDEDSVWSELQSLNLGRCSNITDACVSEVARGCPNLQSLDLTYCRNITDASVSEVARRCSKLQTLNLGNNLRRCRNITDASVSEVARRCSNLQTLILLNCSRITDASVLEVARRCSNLQTLNLGGCRNITDASVLEVARRCSNLQTLNLAYCRNITDLPACWK